MAGKPLSISALAALGCACAVWAGPRDFGLEEFRQAAAARKLNPKLYRIQTEITLDGKPESYRILPGRVTGADLRGLMYGLLEAAEQIRETGRLKAAKGEPAVPMRGIRVFLHNEDLERDWYYSRDYWTAFLQMLARCRFNRFNLVFAHQTHYLAPPYPFWLHVPEFPEIRVPGLAAAGRDRNLEMLRFISQTAADHAVDFTLGVWQHNVQANMKPTVEGITAENIGPYSRKALEAVLAACPAIRGVQVRTNIESGIPNDRQVGFYRDYVYPALASAGRRVSLDLRGWLMSPGMMDAARNAGVPLRLSSKYWAEDMARPYQPAETFPNYSFLNFLEKPRDYDFYWEIWGLGSHRLLAWGDPDFVRRAAPTLTLSGTNGFEIDPPLAQKGFGNRPGKWGVFTEAAKDRVFWNYEFERYWLFYLLWGRLTYDPKTPERVWLGELERRFGKAAARDVLDAYRHGSRVLGEIVAAHLADPNMYLWPEINPGGLLDAYAQVRSSDWRFIAHPTEFVRARLAGEASARQTPADTAGLLHSLALGTERAAARARAKVDPRNKEWRSTETDLEVQALLARFHGRKQMAADHLAWFNETGDDTGLYAARREAIAMRAIWEKLVKLTDGVYPEEMAFGPADYGHWKHKLPYVVHDLERLNERVKLHERFGRIAAGIDFGGPPAAPRGGSYRNDPFVLGNTIQPGFQRADADTRFDARTGFGWADAGGRRTVALPPIPFAEVRAAENNPKHLRADMLFGDYVQGSGPQVFRVRAEPGGYRVHLLHPDRAATERTASASAAGQVDIAMPEGEWRVSAIVLQAVSPQPRTLPAHWPRRFPRPALEHTPPLSVAAAKPLTLGLRIRPAARVEKVRLHYRPLNQMTRWKVVEAPPAKAQFTIAAEDVSARWDLQYYFEVLTEGGSGWFQPDPAAATPYYVVRVD